MIKMKVDGNNEYIKRTDKKIIRVEKGFAPFLIIAPMVLGSWFIYSWWIYGFTQGISDFNTELLLGLIILIGNISFDIPFIRSLRKEERKAEGKEK